MNFFSFLPRSHECRISNINTFLLSPRMFLSFSYPGLRICKLLLHLCGDSCPENVDKANCIVPQIGGRFVFLPMRMSQRAVRFPRSLSSDSSSHELGVREVILVPRGNDNSLDSVEVYSLLKNLKSTKATMPNLHIRKFVRRKLSNGMSNTNSLSLLANDFLKYSFLLF